MTERQFNRDQLDFESFERSKDLRLVTALVINARSGKPLIIAFQNEEALDRTLDTSQMVFYSRSRNGIWLKGETSGNKLIVVNRALNCENDTIKYYVDPVGPACHLNTESCFDTVEK